MGSRRSDAPPKKGGVRFREGTKPASNREHTPSTNADADDQTTRRAKRQRPDYNADEIDDIDDYVPDEDSNNLPGESKTLQAKRQRRLRQHADDDDEDDAHGSSANTRINQETSLASEGIAIEPFHMYDENNDGTGYFDGDTYVFRRGNSEAVGEEPDAWLDNLQNADHGDDEKVSLAKQSIVDEGSENTRKTDSLSKDELYAKLLPLVSDSESVTQALVRYGNLMKHNQGAPLEMAKQALNDITELASALLLQGDVSIYDKTRKDILRALPQETQKESESTTTPAGSRRKVHWEYQGNQDGQIHGPYTTQQMKGWIQQGYFVGATAVRVRTVEDAASSLSNDLLNDLLEDDDDNDAEKPAAEQVRGEWMMSDRVPFVEYE